MGRNSCYHYKINGKIYKSVGEVAKEYDFTYTKALAMINVKKIDPNGNMVKRIRIVSELDQVSQF